MSKPTDAAAIETFLPRDAAAAPSVRRTLRLLFLTLFLRGRSARGLDKKGAPRSVGSKLAFSLLFYALFGMVAVMFRSQPILLLSTYLHAMSLMFLGLFVASSAGEILFNRDEADILLHRPIEPRALLWAKIGVLAEVSVWLAGAFNLVGLLVGATSPTGGWLYVPVHAASTVMQAFFCTGLVVLVYQLCLRWFGRERLEGLMTTAQVVLSLSAVLASQMAPELFRAFENGKAFTMPWWMMVFPPAWFGGIDDALAGSGAGTSWALAAAGCLATAIVLTLAFGKLAHDYEAGLQMLSENSARRVRTEGGRRWLDRLVDAPPLRWWLRDPRQRAAFLLTAAYLARDRDVKLRVYPAVAPYLILPVVFMMRDMTRNGGDNPADGFGMVFASSYIGIVPMMAINLLQFSQHWQAADLFRSAPMSGPAPICMGTSKAVLLFLALPLSIALVASAWLIRHDVGSMALLVPGMILLPVMALMPSLGGRGIPFSHATEEAKSASRGLAMMGTLMVTMALSGVALAAQKFGWLGWMIGVEAVLVGLVYLMLRRNVTRAPWPAID